MDHRIIATNKGLNSNNITTIETGNKQPKNVPVMDGIWQEDSLSLILLT